MTSDLRSLLAAIVADSGDDTARLAYADCLEEHGNSARAEFIRVQVQAEPLHPHANARAALETRAQRLFAKHWAEWWAEVREGVGLPTDGQNVYCKTGYTALAVRKPPGIRPTQAPQYHIAFRRGFPESVAAPALSAGPEPCGAYLARWSVISPLTELVVVGAAAEPRYAWPEGEHLRTVRRLVFREHTADAILAAAASPRLAAIDHLTLDGTWAIQPPDLGDRPSLALMRAHAPRLRHLAVRIDTRRLAELVNHVEPLVVLESLRLPISWWDGRGDPCLRAVAGAPQFAGVQRLTLAGAGSPDDFAAAVLSPAWERLRYLDVNFGWAGVWSGAPRRGDELPNLVEFRLAGVRLTADAAHDLASSPLLKRVKHFALSGDYQNGRALLPLVDAVDPDRIETFALGIPHLPERAANALRAKFGDRFRLLAS
jgi:uncharacterized protein (TIGR02996 family)